MTTSPPPPAPPGAPDGAPDHEPLSAESASRHGPHLTYLPGLDGLRALAVGAVLAYHYRADGSLLPGGYLGVEVFFVISGYLITSLLLAEHRRDGTVGLRSFWMRRARRLLPALFLLLAVCTAASVLFLPEEVAGMRGDVAAALTYTTNWYQVFSEQSYFESVGRPPLLQHLWSLAVEEQFYVVWPLLFSAAMAWLGRRRFLAAILAGVAGSTVLLWGLWSPTEDPTRIYYGTDTRAAGLLVGAALAFVWSPWRLRDRTGRGARLLLDSVGFGAMALLVYHFVRLGEYDPALYRGGFLRVSALTALVIAVTAHPASHVGGLRAGTLGRHLSLANPALVWIGLRSYGIYLWHWPVFQVTRPDLDVTWSAPVLAAVRLAATVGMAELSFRVVETPIRRGALGRWWSATRVGEGPHRRRAWWRVGGAGVAAGLAVSVLAFAVVRAESPDAPTFLAAGASTQAAALPPAIGDTVPPPAVVDPTGTGVTASEPTVSTTSPTTAPVGTPDGTGQPVVGPDGSTPPPSEPPPPPSPPPPPPSAVVPVNVGRVTAIGDSVMAGAAPQVYEKFAANAHIDAMVNRQVDVGIQILTAWRDAGLLGDVVLVHLGNNGTFFDFQLDQMLAVLTGVPKVVLVTNKVPRVWEGPNNAVITSAPAKAPNVVVVDWKGYSEGHPEWFYDDGIHLRPEGARAYADYIASVLAST